MESILTATNLGVEFGGLKAVSNFELAIGQNEMDSSATTTSSRGMSSYFAISSTVG